MKGSIMNKSLRKFAMTYFSLLLCIFLIMIPLYIKTYNLFKNRELRINEAMLQNGIAQFDSSIRSLSSLVQGFFNDNRNLIMTRNHDAIQLPDYYDVMEIQNDFHWAMSSQSLITDCGIVFKNQIVLTRFRTFIDGGDYYGGFFQAKGYEEAAWRQQISDHPSPHLMSSLQVWSYDYGPYEALVWTSPVLETTSSDQRGYFYGTICVENLLDLIVAENAQESSFLIIKDSSGELLLSHNYRNTMEGYVTYSSFARTADINFIVGIPYSLFSSQLAPLRQTVLVYFLIALVIGILLSLLFAWKNSLPILQLVRSIRSSRIPDTISESKSDDALDYVNKAIAGMNKTLDDFERRIRQQKIDMKRNIFEKVLFGICMYENTERNDLANFFPDFPACYQLALIRLTNKGNESPDILISRQLLAQKFLESSFPTDVYIHPIDSNFFVLLLPIHAEKDYTDGKWHDFLKAFNPTDLQEGEYPMRISLSTGFAGSSQLLIAFTQVRHVMRLSGGEDGIPVWQPADFPGQEARMPLDFSQLQQLYSALQTGRKEFVSSVVDSIRARIQDMGCMDELLYQQVFYDLRGVLLRIKIEQYYILSAVELPVQVMSSSFTSQIASIKECCDSICEIIGQKNLKDTFPDRILSFIDKNLTCPGFYSKTVTREFGIGVSKLSKIIHGATGKGFFEYVEDHRIEKALNLLNTKTISITDVARTCGFSSYNSMYKAFRRKCKVSPGAIKERA
jgi:two-component system, response regulator YesN